MTAFGITDAARIIREMPGPKDGCVSGAYITGNGMGECELRMFDVYLTTIETPEQLAAAVLLFGSLEVCDD